MKPSKDKIHVIHNFISKEDIDNALDVIANKEKAQWRDNPRVLIVPSYILECSNILTSQTLAVSKKIKEIFSVDKEIYCVDSQLGTWTHSGAADLHVDTVGAEFTKFSSIIYLTSDYDGGEITFPELDFTYKPVAGDLILFPSHGYLHEVKTVTNGDRSTIVGWYSDVHPSLWWTTEHNPTDEELY